MTLPARHAGGGASARPHSHGEDRVGEAPARSRRLLLSLVLTVVLVGVQLVAGLAAHSVSVLSDAGHNITDVLAIAASILAVRLTLRPRSATRTFGLHRATILAALLNAALIGIVTVAIAIEAVHRLSDPRPVRGGIVTAVAIAALLCNGVAALSLAEHRRDLNMRAAMLHMAGDALASLAVLCAGIILLVDSGAHWADPAASLVVALIIVVEAFRLLRQSVDVLLEGVPADVDLAALHDAMAAPAGVAGVHDLHVWSLSSDVRMLSAHLVLSGHPTLEEAQDVGDRVKEAISTRFAIAHSTLELECDRCLDDLDHTDHFGSPDRHATGPTQGPAAG